jgi:beta-N-acetylhexosaminidase
MTAHVVYPALDADRPATLCRRIAHDLLRTELGYDGLLVSDDLEMKAIADRMPIEESAVAAVRAGCDALLVCSSEDLQDRAHAALVRAAEKDERFRARVAEAAERGLAARRLRPPRPVEDERLAEVLDDPRSRALQAELEARGVFS